MLNWICPAPAAEGHRRTQESALRLCCLERGLADQVPSTGRIDIYGVFLSSDLEHEVGTHHKPCNLTCRHQSRMGIVSKFAGLA